MGLYMILARHSSVTTPLRGLGVVGALPPGSRSTAHPGLKTTPLRGCVPAIRRETGEAGLPFSICGKVIHVYWLLVIGFFPTGCDYAE